VFRNQHPLRFLAWDRSWQRGRSHDARRRDSRGLATGFSLLEVVVALVIATLALSALYAALGNALYTDRIATQTTEAVVRARSHLAMAFANETPEPGELEGDDGGGFRWHVRFATLATAPATDNRPAAILYAVSVRITWERGGGISQVQLDSEFLGRPRGQ
jgi:general secretion pathway protein I